MQPKVTTAHTAYCKQKFAKSIPDISLPLADWFLMETRYPPLDLLARKGMVGVSMKGYNPSAGH